MQTEGVHALHYLETVNYIHMTFQTDPARTEFISRDIYSYYSSLPREKLSVSDPEIFYHGWQIKHLFTSVVLEVSHTTAQVMICLLFSPLSENIPERLIDDNSQGSEEWL